MDNEKRFKTKIGFCHILPDKIILTRDGVTENLTPVASGNNIANILVIYIVIACGLLYFAFDEYQKENIVDALFAALIGLGLIYGVVISRNNSSTPIIDRNKIKEIKFTKGLLGLTRSRFEVLFEDENNKIKKRLIMLPGSMTGGQDATKAALKIMTEENLITNTNDKN